MFLAALLVALAILYFVSLYNGIIRKSNAVKQSRSGIEVALTKRYDTLTKMRDVAKGYMEHEKQTLVGVTAMRRGMSLEEMQDADSSMNKASGELIALMESYPQLSSDAVFKELQIGIRDAEEHVQAARRAYNICVTAYNNTIEMFPSRILAHVLGCQGAQLFEGTAEQMQDVKMTF